MSFLFPRTRNKKISVLAPELFVGQVQQKAYSDVLMDNPHAVFCEISVENSRRILDKS